MKYLMIALGLFFGVTSCQEKDDQTGNLVHVDNSNVEVSKVYRPFLHFFTSTGCGGCGRFGIPVFEAVANSMGDSILALPTHFKYNDKFIGGSSTAIEKAMVTHYSSPQIWVNTKEITNTIIPYPLETAMEKTRILLRNEMKSEADAYVGLNAKLKDNGRFEVNLAVKRNKETSGDLYYEIYGMEDGPIGSQAGGDPYVATHYYVNRGGYFGEMGKKLEAAVGETIVEQVEYVPCVDCTNTNMYFYAVVWQETSPGKFAYVNGIQFRK